MSRHIADPFADEIHEHNRTPCCSVEYALDEDGLDPIQALVCDAAAAEPSRMVHEDGEYYAERIIRRAIEQGTLVLASGTSGSAQDRNGLDPKGAGPTGAAGDAQEQSHD